MIYILLDGLRGRGGCEFNSEIRKLYFYVFELFSQMSNVFLERKRILKVLFAKYVQKINKIFYQLFLHLKFFPYLDNILNMLDTL